jgi:hypothetical protein
MVSARGQAFRADINPALLYYQAFLVAPQLSAADDDYFTNDWTGQKLPERFGELVARHDNEFKLLRQAARATAPCDWGIDMSGGPSTLLPHLARAKAAAIATRLRVEWDLQHNREAEARDDLLAAFALARNVSRDGTLISALVQIASEAIDCCTVAENFGRFSPESLKQLVDGIDAVPAGTVAACVPTEQAVFDQWVLRKIAELQKANPGNEAKVMAAIHELLAGVLDPQDGQPRITLNPDPEQTNNWWESLSQAAGGTSEGVVKLVRDAESLDEKLAAILALPHGDYESRIKEFKAQIEQSPNPYFSRTLQQWERARRREFRVQLSLAMVRTAVEYKLHGEAGLQSVADPCGQGPFAFKRFVFEGVDRGFELSSPFDAGNPWPEAMIFVEKEGPPFRVFGRAMGQARLGPPAQK